jgi:resolvase-like protein
MPDGAPYFSAVILAVVVGAACRDGDTLVATELDRLARSPPDARALAEELTQRQLSL